jgi:uncharacterized membrane protein
MRNVFLRYLLEIVLEVPFFVLIYPIFSLLMVAHNTSSSVLDHYPWGVLFFFGWVLMYRAVFGQLIVVLAMRILVNRLSYNLIWIDSAVNLVTLAFLTAVVRYCFGYAFLDRFGATLTCTFFVVTFVPFISRPTFDAILRYCKAVKERS